MRRRLISAIACVVVSSLIAGTQLSAQETRWSRFRGPNGSGVVEVEDLPVEFGPGNNEIWSQEVPPGRSSPVLGDEHVFVTGVEDTVRSVVAIGRETGQVAWRRDFEASYAVDMYHGSDAGSATPTTDGTNVFAFFNDIGLIALDGQGEEIWRLAMGPFDNYYGIASSPVVAGDLLLLACDQKRGSFLLALDRATGAEVWRRERPGRAEAWTTPILHAGPDGQPQILVFGNGFLDAYALETGEPFWEATEVGPIPVASPVVHEDMLIVGAIDQASYLPATYDALLAAGDDDNNGGISHDEVGDLPALAAWESHFVYLDADGDGLIGRSEYDTVANGFAESSPGVAGFVLADGPPTAAWREIRAVPNLSSPIVYRDLLYTVTDNGIVSALNPVSGELVWRERLSRGGANVLASAVAGDGHLFIATDGGEVHVLVAGQEAKIVAVNELDAPIAATPALAPGRIFVRTAERLHAFGPVTQE